jgi:hypothetical protein
MLSRKDIKELAYKINLFNKKELKFTSKQVKIINLL